MGHIVMLRFLSTLIAFLTVAVASVAAADSTRIGDIIIEQPWARASIGTSRPAAAFLTIKNTGSTEDVLVSIKTSIAGVAEVHKSEIKDGISTMGLAGPIEIPAKETITLTPGGYHIMLMMLQQPLKKGEQFAMVLNFKKAGSIDVVVQVKGVGATGPIK